MKMKMKPLTLVELDRLAIDLAKAISYAESWIEELDPDCDNSWSVELATRTLTAIAMAQAFAAEFADLGLVEHLRRIAVAVRDAADEPDPRDD